jgi:methylated-DNA-[protein]-cysteine S-methyltransferase
VAFLFTGFYIFTVRHQFMDQAYIKTPLGITCITGDASGISKISISDDETPVSETIPEHLADAINQLQEYFSGNRNQFNFKISPKGTDFQKRVWEALLKIPFGTTTSYHALSKQLGDIKAIRAVASANGKNPLWIVVPCHRVIGSDGSLTGYAGGLWRKKWLLEHECPSTQGSLF